MSIIKLFPIIMVFLILFFNTNNLESSLSNDMYTYSVHGEYFGNYILEVSGNYRTQFTGNNSDYKYSYLRIVYKYFFNLNIFFNNNSYNFLYIYYLREYHIEYFNIPNNIVLSINNTLNSVLNKTILENSVKVEPYLLIEIDIDEQSQNRVLFKKIGDNRLVNGLSLFDDVICFESTIYREEITGSVAKRFMSKTYYDAISYTPLYVYIHSIYIDLFNETNYLRIVLEITQKNIGYSLSRISRSKTYYIVFENKLSGRIGLITYGNSIIRIFNRNNTLFVNIDTNHPYRIVIITDHPVEIKYSKIDLDIFYLKTNNIYISTILLSNTEHYIVFNYNISSLKTIGGNSTFIHEITIQEKQYSSTSIVIFTLFINAVIIYFVYKICRFFTKILYETVK